MTTSPERFICDQCQTYTATSIDMEARLWCSRCWNTAAEQVTERSTCCAPLVIDIPYLRLLWPLNSTEDYLLLVSDDVRERWATRLGLPQRAIEEKEKHP